MAIDQRQAAGERRAALDEITSGEVRDLAQCAMHVYPSCSPAAVAGAVREWVSTWRRVPAITYPLAYVRASRGQLDPIVARHAARERTA